MKLKLFGGTHTCRFVIVPRCAMQRSVVPTAHKVFSQLRVVEHAKSLTKEIGCFFLAKFSHNVLVSVLS